METTQGLQGTKIALLIDFDNVILGVDDPGFDVELVVNALRSRGIVVMGRAYGDWYRHHRHRRKLMEQGIELVETPVFGPLIKNSADIRIVLDGFEIAMSQAHIDTFCLVSGDSDFLPLIKKLQYLGKTVIVIAGSKFTSDLVRRNCNEYVSYENLLAESVGATEDVSVLEGAFALLERAINTLNERGMDVRSSTVKQMMLQLNPAFSEHTFGYNQFKQFLDKAARSNMIKLGTRGNSGEFAVFLPNEVDESVTFIEPQREGAASGPSRDRRRTQGRETSAREANGRTDRRDPREAKARPARESEPAAPAETLTGAAVEDVNGIDVATIDEITASIPAQPDVPTGPADVADDIMEHGFLSGAASGRGNLRRGRLRFSAKSGRTFTTPANSASLSNSAEATASPTGVDPAVITPTDALPMDAVAVEQTVPADEGTTIKGIGEPINTPEIEGAKAADTDGLLEAAPASEAPFQAGYQHTQEMDAGSDLTTAQAREDTAIDAQAVSVMDPEATVGTSHDDAPPVEPAPTKKRATRSRRRRSTAPHSGSETSNGSAAEGEQGESVGGSDIATSPDAAADGVIQTAEAVAGAGDAIKKSTRSRRGGTRRNTPRAAQEKPPQETPPTDGGS